MWEGFRDQRTESTWLRFYAGEAGADGFHGELYNSGA